MEIISPPSLVDSAVQRIRNVIETQKLAPGTRLPTEPELMQRLGISRTVLREAMSRLELLGLVKIRAGKGTQVGDPDTLDAGSRLIRTALTLSSRDLLQFNELRTGIECESARLAAERATESEIADLQRRCVELGATETRELYVQLDCAFHVAIAQISKSALILSVLQIVQDFMASSMERTMLPTPDYKLGRKLHSDIVAAIAAHDANAAEAAMRRHMDVNRHVLMNH